MINQLKQEKVSPIINKNYFNDGNTIVNKLLTST